MLNEDLPTVLKETFPLRGPLESCAGFLYLLRVQLGLVMVLVPSLAFTASLAVTAQRRRS